MTRPLFTIVVPTYKRPGQIKACLSALGALDFPRDRFEVLVVDDGSDMPPKDVVADLQGTIDAALVMQQHAGPAAARNTGAAQARGRYLAFTDDDCAPAPDWLRVLEAVSARSPNCAVGGHTINALPGNPYSTTSQLLVDYLYSYYNVDAHGGRFFTSNNLSVPADAFHAVGGFDTTFPGAAAEDRDFCDRWLRHGFQMIHSPEALIYHSHALTMRTFLKQHFGYGRGAARFHTLRARRGLGSVELEPLSFYLNMVRYPFKRVSGGRAFVLASLLALTQVANAAGFFSK